MRTALVWFYLGVAITLGGVGCAPAPDGADLILRDGRIVTMDENQPEAQAIAIRGDRIVAVGDLATIDALRGADTEVVELAGRLVTPGFIEGHGHFTGIGRALQNVDLRDAGSWDEVIERVAARVDDVDPGQWLLGWGWHQDKWSAPPDVTVEGYPVHDRLSERIPDVPVLLKHAAGSHAGMINAKALELTGIGPDTPDPAGGKILRHADGRPTGVLREKAYDLALEIQIEAEEGADDETIRRLRRREAELAAEECIRHGITGFHDAGSGFVTVEVLREMADAGELPLRLWVMLDEPSATLAERAADYRWDWIAGGHLTVGGIKRYMDGALGSHGAWLLEPYSDLPESAGLNTSSIEAIEQAARVAIEQDFQLCVHAIGDRGNRETLDLFERVFAEYPDKTDLRWRVEHAQHLSPDDIPRFAELGVIASMQGVHCTSDAPWVPERLGEQRSREGAYVWRSLLESGAVVINGTDAPIEDVDPLANVYSAVTRRPAGADAPFYPEQSMTPLEALRAATIDAAYAARQDDRVGSLTVGKVADLVVLSADLLAIDAERIPEVRVELTIVGGEVRYRAE